MSLAEAATLNHTLRSESSSADIALTGNIICGQSLLLNGAVMQITSRSCTYLPTEREREREREIERENTTQL